MSQNKQGMQWVLGALGVLLYMGSLCLQVVRTLPSSRSSLPLLYPQIQYYITVYRSQSLMQQHSSGSGFYKFVSDGSSYSGTCPYLRFVRGENFSG
jgi:hypothetical protein